MAQRINEQIGVFPAIEAKFHLFEIDSEMLCAESMPRSHDAALEKRESRFDRVGMNVSHDVHAGTMIDFLVLTYPLGFAHCSIILRCIIRENDFHILGDILADVLSKRAAFGIAGMEEAEIAVAFANANNYFFVVHASDAAFSAIHATNIGSVHFHFAIEHRLIGLRHCVADTMAEIPSCLVGADSESALNLAGRNSFLRFTEKQRRGKPSREWQVRIIENGSRRNRELVVAIFAVEQMLFGFELNDGSLAAEAARSLWEAQASEQFSALGIRREHDVYVH